MNLFQKLLMIILVAGILMLVGVGFAKPFIKQTRRNADRIRYAKVEGTESSEAK